MTSHASTGIILTFFILIILPLYGKESSKTEKEIRFNIIGSGITGRDMAHGGCDWLDHPGIREIPLVMTPVPTLSLHIQPGTSKTDTLISTGYTVDAVLTPIGISASSEFYTKFTPLLTLSAGIQTATGWNYGTSLRSVGIYNPEKKEYESVTALTELSYAINGSVKLLVPFGKQLISQFVYTTEYTGFTGAANGQPWECNLQKDMVNGWKYQAGAGLIYLASGEKIKTVGITYTVYGWYRDTYFDDCYQPYDPSFITHSLSPMISLDLTKRQSLVIIGTVCRERKFENEDYDSGELFMQNCTGGVWRFKSILCIWSIKLN